MSALASVSLARSLALINPLRQPPHPQIPLTSRTPQGLELFSRVGAVAEAEGHHPDLHLEGWNNVTLSLWTHERGGLTENDFVVAAKIDRLELGDLLSKKPPAPLP